MPEPSVTTAWGAPRGDGGDPPGAQHPSLPPAAPGSRAPCGEQRAGPWGAAPGGVGGCLGKAGGGLAPAPPAKLHGAQ